MRSILAVTLLALALSAAVGCSPARYAGYDEQHIAHGATTDAGAPPPSDGGHVTPHDAWVAPGTDAWAPPGEDAWVAPEPDAWTMPSCPTFGGDVEPIYQRHCATCHTTGTEVHFGSSYSAANRTSSSCGGSMAACTLQLGRPGGSMARRDALGGFDSSEQATIQSWIDCGRPM
jgi:hypothetical protein